MTTLRCSPQRRICCLLTAAAVIFGAAFAVLYFQLTRHMEEICEYKGRQTASALVSEAIEQTLAALPEDYLIIERDVSGGIISITTDAAKLNSLDNDLKQRINDSLSHIEDNEMGVPIGTLSGVTFLSGRGAELKIKLHQVGAVDSQIVSEFESAGINQTRHTLKIRIKTELSAILPAHSTDITVEDEYILSETIIVGDIPDTILGSSIFS